MTQSTWQACNKPRAGVSAEVEAMYPRVGGRTSPLKHDTYATVKKGEYKTNSFSVSYNENLYTSSKIPLWQKVYSQADENPYEGLDGTTKTIARLT